MRNERLWAKRRRLKRMDVELTDDDEPGLIGENTTLKDDDAERLRDSEAKNDEDIIKVNEDETVKRDDKNDEEEEQESLMVITSTFRF